MDKTYNLFSTQQLTEKIIVTPGNFDNINLLIKNKLQKKMGNKCNKDGYILANSIKILKRSIGKINSSFFDGSISYNVKYSATICNPKEGSIINVQYIDHNKMGILAKKKGTPLNIVIPKQLHKNKELFKQIDENLKENNTINLKIQIIGKRYEKEDKEIFVIGKLLNIIE